MDENMTENNTNDTADRYDRIAAMYEEAEADGGADSEKGSGAGYSFADPDKASRKPKKAMIIAIIVAAVLALAAGITAFAVSRIGADKLKVAAAFSALMEDEAELQVMTADEKEDVLNTFCYGDATTVYSLNVTGIPNVPVTVGLDGTLARSFDEQKLSCENSISAMNTHIASANIYAEGTEVYLNVPEAFEETFKADTDGLAGNFNDSTLASLAGIQIPEDIDLRPFGDGEKRDIELTDMTELTKECSEELKTLAENIEVTHDKGKTETEIAEGGSVEVRTYHVTVPQADAQALLEAYVDAFEDSGALGTVTDTGADINELMEKAQAGEGFVPEIGDEEEAAESLKKVELGGDILLSVQIDTDGQIRNISTEQPFTLDGYEVELIAAFNGADSCIENEKMAFSVMAPEDGSDTVSGSPVYAFSGETYSYTREADSDGSRDIVFTMSGDVNMEVDLSGLATYEDGIFKANMDKLEVRSEGSSLAVLSGSLNCDTTRADVAAPPVDSIMDLLDLDMMDLLTLAGELQNNYGVLNSALESLGLF